MKSSSHSVGHFQPLGAPAELTQYATRTLDFLNVIEKSLKSVTREAGLINQISAGCKRHAEAIRKSTPVRLLDPEGRVGELLTLATASVVRSYEESIRYRDSARKDGDLLPEDGIVECFNDLVAAFADLHNSNDELRDAVETHDALLAPVTSSVHLDVDSLIAGIFAR